MIRLAQSETFYPTYQEGHTGVTGVNVSIHRPTDGFWYDFVATAFQDAYDANAKQAMAEDDAATNGLWTWTTGWAIPDANATYKVQFEVTDADGTFYADGPMIVVNDAVDFGILTSILVDTGTTLDNKIDSVLTDTGTTLDNKIDSILVDTGTTLNSLVDTIESTIDGPIHSTLDAIHSTIDGPIDSAITQNTGLISDVLSTVDSAIHSTLDAVHSTIDAIHSTIDGPIDSAITQNTGLISDVLSTIDSAIHSTLDAVHSTLDGPILSTLDRNQTDLDTILTDTSSTLDNKIDSILADTTSILIDTGSTLSNTLSGVHSAVDEALGEINNATYGLNALETLISDAISTLDGPITSDLSSIESTVSYIEGAVGGDSDNITSILADTKEINSQCDSILNNTTSILTDTGTTLNGLVSDVLSTLDGPVTSQLSTIESTVSYLEGAGGGDWGAKEKAQIRSALGISGATSALEAYGSVSRLDNASYGLNALETLVSDVLSTIDGPVISDLSSIESTVSYLEGAGGGDWGAKEKAQIRSALGISGATSALEAWGNVSRLDNPTYGLAAANTTRSQVLSTLDGPLTNYLTSIVDDTSKMHSTLDGPIDSQITANAGLVSDVISTLDGPILSTLDGPILSTLDRNQTDLDTLITDTSSTLDNKLDSILVDTGTTLNNLITSVLDDTGSALSNTLSGVHSAVDEVLSHLDNATYGMDALETLISQVLADTGTTLDDKIDSILVYVNSAMTEMAAGAPPASPTPRQAQNYLYRQWRNKVITDSATQKLYDDAGTTVLLSCAVSDDGTDFTKGEMA